MSFEMLSSKIEKMSNYRAALDAAMLFLLHIPQRWRSASDRGRTALESARVDVPAFSQAIEMRSP
jgi:hypothetical protein